MGRTREILISKDTSIDMAEEYILREMKDIRCEDSVVLNMSAACSVTAKNISLLIIISYLAYEKTNNNVKLSNVSAELKQYLQKIGFWNLPYISHRGHLDRLSDQGTGGKPVVLPIRFVEKWERMQDIFRMIRQTQVSGISDELKTTLSGILNALGENCMDHSGLEDEVGFYVFMEENVDSVMLIVLDMGMGFYNSLCRKYPKITSDSEAVCKVLLEHISCRAYDGGIGYYHIKKLIDSHNGSIIIRSGNAIVHYGDERIKRTEETDEQITGCCVLVELKKDVDNAESY